MKIHHIMKDGTEAENLTGHTVKIAWLIRQIVGEVKDANV